MAVVLVVGGSRGIGAELVARFVRAGDTVAATHRGGGLQLLDGVAGVLPIECDVRSSASVDSAFDTAERQVGAVGIVIFNAGVTADKLMMRMDDDTWNSTLDTNLSGAFRVARRASRPMIKAKSGSVVFVSSAAAAFGAAGQVNYTAAKAGLVGIARSMVREFGSRGIRVNVVAPGPTETDMTAALSEPQREAMRQAVPLGRFGQPSEIAEVVEFVSKATFMTGAVVPVDGGAGMGQ